MADTRSDAGSEWDARLRRVHALCRDEYHFALIEHDLGAGWAIYRQGSGEWLRGGRLNLQRPTSLDRVEDVLWELHRFDAPLERHRRHRELVVARRKRLTEWLSFTLLVAVGATVLWFLR